MAKKTKRASKIDRQIGRWVNSLSSEQMCKIYEIIDDPVGPEIAAMTDDELAAALGI